MDKHTLIQAVTKKYWNTVNDERPSSIAECYDDETGSLDGEKYDEQRAKEDELEALDRALYEIMYEKTEEESTVNDDSTRSSSTRTSRRTKRQKKSLAPYYFDDAGNRIEYKPVDTLWYIQYVRSPMIEDAKFLRQFRRRFRIPYVELAGLVEEVLESGMFTRWQGKDAVGCDSSPIELLVLGALRYLGRGLTFDDLEEYTAINEETHRQFFHRFIEFGATVLHAKYVRFPRNAAEYGPHQEEFTVGGLNGAGFSTDATNVIMWNCAHNLRQAHMGFKSSHPSRTYNLSCNHRRRILYTTKGHASRWNDKTLALYDEFMGGIRDGRLLPVILD